MNRTWRTPLAWRNLTHSGRRLALALLGIGFAVILIFAQTGFQNALLDSSVRTIDVLDADLVITSTALNTLGSSATFDRRCLVLARGCPGVKAVHPVYMQFMGAPWKGPTGKPHPIRVLACDVDAPPFIGLDIAPHATALHAPSSALLDIRGKTSRYGLPSRPEDIVGQSGELIGRTVHLVGAFAMGTDFIADGNLLMSDVNFARYFPNRAPGRSPLSVVDFGVVQLEPGASREEVRTRLSTLLAPEAKVTTKQQLIDNEMLFLNKSTGIGFIFSLGKWIGFLVGVIICYQIVNADVADHLGEFATLKAMGYGNGYFVGLVMQEAIFLSVLSFLPGLLFSAVFYYAVAEGTGLAMQLSLARVGSVLAMTVFMCAVSGTLAMQKVFVADPADLY